ncbi:hypothetical protein ACFL6S_05405, partial [Candidatus Poribacteria bacterium]
ATDGIALLQTLQPFLKLAKVANSFDADISLPWRDAHSNTFEPLFSSVRVASSYLLSSAVLAENNSRYVTQLLALGSIKNETQM